MRERRSFHDEDAEEEKSGPADGRLRRAADRPAGSPEGPLAAELRRRAGDGPESGDRLRQGQLRHGNGTAEPGAAVSGSGAGGERFAHGDGEGPGGRAAQCAVSFGRRGAAGPGLHRKRGQPDLSELLRPLAPQAAAQAPADPSGVFGGV